MELLMFDRITYELFVNLHITLGRYIHGLHNLLQSLEVMQYRGRNFGWEQHHYLRIRATAVYRNANSIGGQMSQRGALNGTSSLGRSHDDFCVFPAMAVDGFISYFRSKLLTVAKQALQEGIIVLLNCQPQSFPYRLEYAHVALSSTAVFLLTHPNYSFAHADHESLGGCTPSHY